MSDRYGFRRKNSDVAHLPGWTTNEDGRSACRRVLYADSDIWSMQDGFDPHGRVRLCAQCRNDLEWVTTSRREILDAWGPR